MPRFKIVSSGLTDVGLKRDHNEDYVLIDGEHGLFVLADGMGGHASGEVASQLAVSHFADFFNDTCQQDGFVWPYDVTGLETFAERAVANGIQHANDRVFIESMRDRRYDGMGTTLAIMADADDKMVLAHVGDSRIYRFRGGVLTQLTEDHSLINHFKRTRGMSDEEVKSIASRNVIVRAIGLKEYVEPDVKVVDKRAGDVYLLCSDGLSDLVEDWVVENVLEGGIDDLDDTCKRLVRLANQRGGKDNISVILLRVENDTTVSDAVAREPERQWATPSSPDTDVRSVVIGASGRSSASDTGSTSSPPPLPPNLRAGSGSTMIERRGPSRATSARERGLEPGGGSHSSGPGHRVGITPTSEPSSPANYHAYRETRREPEGADPAGHDSTHRDTVPMPADFAAQVIKEQRAKARIRDTGPRARALNEPVSLATHDEDEMAWRAAPGHRATPPRGAASSGTGSSGTGSSGPASSGTGSSGAGSYAKADSKKRREQSREEDVVLMDADGVARVASRSAAGDARPSPSDSANPAPGEDSAFSLDVPDEQSASAGSSAATSATENGQAGKELSEQGILTAAAKPFDPIASIRDPELRSVFERARVAPLPPISAPDER